MQDNKVVYLDFELEIGIGSGREYPVAVIRSPAGETEKITMRFPFDELELRNKLMELQVAILRSGGGRRKTVSPNEQPIQDFGQKLFDWLFDRELRSLYEVSKHKAADQGKGLRLKLRIQSPELASLPWEFLYDSREGNYICLSTMTPIVRYMELPKPVKALTVTPPLRILGMIASPPSLPALNVEREKQRMEESIKNLRSIGLIELTWLDGQTWQDLMRAMRRGPWHIFHFVGHGGFDHKSDQGVIALSEEGAQTHFRLNATQLGRLLADHTSLRLVLLNSCKGAEGSERDIFSSTASILVQRGIPAVLAMQYEISDRAAIEFSRTFYEALADEMPIDAAVAEARKAINIALDDSVEWGTPVLYMRSYDGIMFNIQQKEISSLEEERQKREEQEKTAQLEKERRDREEQEKAARLEKERLEREAQEKTAQLEKETKKPQTLPTKPLVTTIITEKDNMVLIPAGEFQMGDNDLSDAKVHSVYLDAFYIDKYEVTNAQYRKFVEATGRKEPEGYGYAKGEWQSGFKPWSDRNFNGDDQPVICVSWEDAKAYADWARKRLPTEAEWEKAARGGLEGKKYVWGDEWPPPSKAGNFADISAKKVFKDLSIIDGYDDGYAYTSPVGSFKPNGYGLYDMAGNVWEWCADWYDSNYYANSPKSNPTGPSLEQYKVLRGGSWDYGSPDNLRVSSRYRFNPDDGGDYSDRGFRCVSLRVSQ